MSKLNKIFIAFIVGIAMIFGIAGCSAGSSEFQKKIDDLQSRIAEIEDEISERDAIIEGLKEQIKKQEEKIEQLEKDLKEEIMNGKEPVGTFYTLQEAYAYGLLTQKDLLSIAYYHNGGRFDNEEIMSESYQPAPKIPEVLSDITELKIKITAAEEYREKHNIKDAEADGFTITEYCGTYGDCVAVMMEDVYTGTFGIIWTESIAGVKFHYNGRTIKIWVGIKLTEETESVGSIYTVQEAYNNGWLTQEDLLSIAYYHNGGRTDNEEIMSEGYLPAPKIPEVLSGITESKIKRATAEEYRQKHIIKYAEAEGFTITEYCGTYGDCVAVMTTDIYSGFTDAVWTDTIGGVNIFYSDGNSIKIWRAE